MPYLLLQVWCVESQEQQYQNWTVDSSQISLNVSNLKAGGQYWIIMAAVNGAGVGTLSDPQEFVISEPIVCNLRPHLGCVVNVCFYQHNETTSQYFFSVLTQTQRHAASASQTSKAETWSISWICFTILW